MVWLVPVKLTVLVPAVKIPPLLFQFPETLMVCEPAATVMLADVLLKPAIEGLTSNVAVPEPELASKYTIVPASGRLAAPGAPPEVAAQWLAASDQFPVPPTQ